MVAFNHYATGLNGIDRNLTMRISRALHSDLRLGQSVLQKVAHKYCDDLTGCCKMLRSPDR